MLKSKCTDNVLNLNCLRGRPDTGNSSVNRCRQPAAGRHRILGKLCFGLFRPQILGCKMKQLKLSANILYRNHLKRSNFLQLLRKCGSLLNNVSFYFSRTFYLLHYCITARFEFSVKASQLQTRLPLREDTTLLKPQ